MAKCMSKKVTQPMSNVLRWLFEHPNIRITWTGDNSSRPAWSARWASEDARQHMIKTFSDLAKVNFIHDIDVAKQTGARLSRNQGGTPPLARPTFFGLLKRGLIRAVEKRIPMKGFTEMYYYQLTAEGKQAATGLRLIKATDLGGGAK